MQSGIRSRVDEAVPVVTGRTDEETIGVVFGNWREDDAIQERFNPFLEIDQAKALRDGVMTQYLVKPGHLVRPPLEPLLRERAARAREGLTRLLIGQRRWGRQLIERYLGSPFTDEAWSTLCREASR